MYAMALPPDQRLLLSQMKQRLGLSLRAMGDMIGVKHVTVRSWIEGLNDPAPGQYERLVSELYAEERRQEDDGKIVIVKRKRLTKKVLASTINAAEHVDMEEQGGGKEVSYNAPVSGNKSWPREVIDLALSPHAEIGEVIIVEEKEAEIGQAVEAHVGGRFIHRYLWRDKSGLLLKDGSGLLEDVAVERRDIRGVVIQRIETLPGEITRTSEFKHGMRHRF